MGMTFREIAIHAKGYNARKVTDHNESIAVAHSLAWMIRVDATKFPKRAKELFDGPTDTVPESKEMARARRLARLDSFAGITKNPTVLKVLR